MTDASHPSSRLAAIVRALLLVLAGAGLAALLLVNPFGWPLPWRSALSGGPATSPESPSGATLWTCGMHPQVMQNEPGTCPICHMDLTPLQQGPVSTDASGRRIVFYRDPDDLMAVSPVPATSPAGVAYEPVYAEDDPAEGPEVFIESGLVQRMNVTTARVERDDLVQAVRTVGIVEFDHELETTVTVKYRGYVERVHVHLVGEEVRRGQPLFDVYAPELVQTQQDLLAALAYARRMEAADAASGDARRRATDLVEASRERLRFWDISSSQIGRIEESGRVTRILTVTAPVSGVITRQEESLSGREVSPGMSIYTIADVSRVWVTAEIYEDQIAAIRSQKTAWVQLDAFPGERFPARVQAIKPWVERQARTVHVTLALDNPGGRLRQGMYAQVEFEPVTAAGVLLVSSQAILRTGQRNVAVVAKGGGRFAPREVVLGHEAGGRVVVLEGLAEGDEIVTSAQFLIDSESSLKAAVQAMIAGAR